MDRTLRSILWILVILVLLSSFSAGWFFVGKERLHNEYVNLEILFKTTAERLKKELASSKRENTKLTARLKIVERELGTAESRNRDFKSQQEELLKERDDLDRELVRVKKGKFFLEKKLKDMESNRFLARLLKERAALEVDFGKLKDSMAPKDLMIASLKKENEDLNIRLSNADKEKELLVQTLEDSTEVAEILSRDLLKEKDATGEAKGALESAKAENRLLETKISELEKIFEEFDMLLTEREKAVKKVSSLERELEYRNQDIDRLKLALQKTARVAEETRAEAYHSPDEVELPPIVLQRESQSSYGVDTSSLGGVSRTSSLKGNVLTVNREHNFVVINLGTEDGVDVGARFDVYRGEVSIGSIEVIQARNNIAAADIKDIKGGFSIEADDAVVK